MTTKREAAAKHRAAAAAHEAAAADETPHSHEASRAAEEASEEAGAADAAAGTRWHTAGPICSAEFSYTGWTSEEHRNTAEAHREDATRLEAEADADHE